MAGKPKSYRDKLPPIFFEVAEVNREFEVRLAEIQTECDRKLAALGPNPPKERRSEIGIIYRASATFLDAQLVIKLGEIQKRHGPSIAFNKLAYSYFDLSNHADTTEDNLQRLFEYMHWERHSESQRKTSHLVGEGDVSALKRLHRTDEDQFRVLAGKGPLKKYQHDVIHRQFLELVLCFEMSPLTEEERADCADDFCACGKSHDADALDKQNGRLKRHLLASAAPESQ